MLWALAAAIRNKCFLSDAYGRDCRANRAAHSDQRKSRPEAAFQFNPDDRRSRGDNLLL
jgi:hypothetical protein